MTTPLPRRDLLKFLTAAIGGGAIASVAAGQGPAAPAVGAIPDLPREVAAALATGRYLPSISNAYWALPQNGIFLPAGVYTSGTIPLTKTANAAFAALALWAIPGSVVIEIEPEQYLFDTAERLNWFHARGITFVGGKGVFRHRFEGDNVNGRFVFDTCIFDSYSECAIGNNARDAPYLRVRDCMFMGAPGRPTIGIAWGGWADCTIIEGNSFLRNRYHLKLGPRLGTTVYVSRNDFMKWDRLTERAADIWFVPSEDPGSYGNVSGQGTVVRENKFGNENLDPDDVRILVAAEGAGSDRLSRGHAERWIDDGARGGFVSAVTIADCLFVGNAEARAPLIRSHIEGLRALSYRHNRHIGGRYPWLCEFMGPRVAVYTATDWSIELGAGDVLVGGMSPFALGFSNRPIGPVADADGVFAGLPGAYPPHGTGDAGAILAKATRATDFVASLATLSDVGTQTEARLERTGGGVAIELKGAAGDRLTWLQCDLLPGSGPAPREIVVEVRQDGGFSVGHRVICRPGTLVCQRFIIPAPLGPATVYLSIRGGEDSSAGQTFRIGDLVVNQGPVPARRGHLQAEGALAGKWNGPHLVLGALHMWEHAGRAFVKSGIPVGPEDGKAIT